MAILKVGFPFYASIADAMLAAGPGDEIQLQPFYSRETATVSHSGMTITGDTTSTDIVLELGVGITTVSLGGTASIDVLDANDGNNIIGNDGDNLITVTGGADAVLGGDGDDRLVVDYRLATGAVTGTVTDVTEAGGGGRLVTINGGFEHLTVLTGGGADTITTGAGDDLIETGEGAGTVTAGEGANRIIGGSGADTITALNGGNFIDGGDGVNTLTSGGGADTILSGTGDDTIVAGAGSDVTTVRGGADTANSGAGVDRLIIDYSASTTAVIGGVAAGSMLAGYSGHVADDGGNVVDFYETENFTITSGSADDQITTGGGTDILHGGAGLDFLAAGGGIDKLFGGGGADTLDGGTAADRLEGGADSDTYIVNTNRDVVVEGAAEGTADHVKASASYDLLEGVFVELLSTTSDKGTGAINLYGNTLKQTITGNAGANLISDGGTGAADLLRGLGGSDTYRVYNTADVIVEGATEGANDTVLTSVTFDLLEGVHIETFGALNTASTASLNLYGNSLTQTITGNAGKNIISDGGKGGSDTLVGLGGDDTYRVYNSGTKIVEAAAAGSDTVEAAVNYTVAAGVYIQVLETTNAAGKSAISLYSNDFGQTVNGNAGNNSLRGYGGNDTINGGAGDDKISGGTGNDTLAGNAGADTYYFSNALGASNVDTINRFSSIDLISLSSAIFTKAGAVGALASAAFWSSTSGLAHDASDRIIYETDTGILRYDPDGTGATAATAFAKMDGLPIMNAGDFVIA